MQAINVCSLHPWHTVALPARAVRSLRYEPAQPCAPELRFSKDKLQDRLEQRLRHFLPQGPAPTLLLSTQLCRICGVLEGLM